jgi:hypothetical protein
MLCVIIKCNLSDYYDTGIKLTRALSLLSGIYNKNRNIFLKLKKNRKTAEIMLYINMSSLGLVNGPPTRPVITPRGFSFFSGRLLMLSQIFSEQFIEIQCARLVLLKAVADIDWECFSKMIWL